MFTVETLDDCYAVAEIRGDQAFRFDFDLKRCYSGPLTTRAAMINVNNATEFMWYRKEGTLRSSAGFHFPVLSEQFSTGG